MCGGVGVAHTPTHTGPPLAVDLFSVDSSQISLYGSISLCSGVRSLTVITLTGQNGDSTFDRITAPDDAQTITQSNHKITVRNGDGLITLKT